MSMPDATTPDPNAEEPALKVGAIMAAATAAIGLLVAFGLKLTPEQTAAILAVVAALAPLVQAFWTRRKVWSPASVARMLRGRTGEGG